jgi:apolipoprotein N-acyltransferase
MNRWKSAEPIPETRIEFTEGNGGNEEGELCAEADRSGKDRGPKSEVVASHEIQPCRSGYAGDATERAGSGAVPLRTGRSAFFVARAAVVWASSLPLNGSSPNPADRVRLALAVCAGLLLASAFPKLGVAGFAWVAPGAMLAAAIGVEGRQAFRLGYVAGLAHYLASLYWLLNIPVMKLAPITGWLALSGFLALYPALWVWLCWRMYPAKMGEASNPSVSSGAGWMPAPLSTALERFLGASWIHRVVWALSCSALWVTWEMLQARLFTGFPWNFLGASQYQMLPILQIASFTGVYGVSFLVAWFAVSLLGAAATVLRRSQSPRLWTGEIALPLLAVIGVAFYGVRQFGQPAATTSQVKIGLVQPSIPQRWIWSPSESSNRFAQLLALSAATLTNATGKPDLLVWPEAAVPGYVRWDTNIHLAVTHFVRRHQVWLVLGSDDAAPRRGGRDPFAYDVFNASFLLGPDGEFRATYRKRRLVICGEYIPFARWLPFLERWTGMGSFAEGQEVVPFRVSELGLKTSVLICFEDVFPHGVREYVGDDTDFLLNLTNNGWFGESAAQWQHAANAVFRAVENGVPLVRCANNGITCWVTPQGQMRDAYLPGTTDAYGAGYKLVQVPRLGGKKREPTFYRRHGDVFGWSCVAWSVLVSGRTFLRRRCDSLFRRLN